ncbi:dual specificity phosphatase, catalytic domain-containing protein [Pseudomonas sp. M47T1]|uniref:phosphatase domain-containing protein n=1 Tax=unclassified Pseudomonas TaxID=196821 RepID=UPI00026087C5|nr:tyrosine-protein phosphatase [Pseudomonas sp. M47T1]EIK97558.1 dual specificity phosphatase, catalytic domain-containing protein [Pseudomonas sp. M47T1]
MPLFRRLLLCLPLCLGLAGNSFADQAPIVAAQRPGQWAQSIDPQYNLYQMSPTLYRSALPDQQAMPLLGKLQIKTVVSFLPESDAGWMKEPQINRVQLPMRTVHADDAQIIAALRAIQEGEAKGPVLIHCKHGLDRTGLVSAMYRVVVQGWSKQEALAEMTQGGFGDTKRMKYGIDYLNNVNVEDVRSALASGACSTNPVAACAIKGLFKQLI